MHERIFPSAAAELSCTCARRGRGVLFAVLVAAAGVAGAQGLPFTEQFDDASLSDAAGTTADWGATQAGQLTLPSANALQNMFSEATPAADMPGEFTTRALQLADMNGDGHLDVVEGTQGRSGVYLNDGAGNFFPRAAFEPVFANTRGVWVADVNGDGYLDAATATFNGRAKLYLNTGDGVTYTAHDITQDVRRSDFIVLVDLNGDGLPDAVTANHDQQFNRIYFNTGDPLLPFGASGVEGVNLGTFGEHTQAIAPGDVDNDGDIDLVALNEDAPNRLHLNDGNGVFTTTAIGPDADDTQDGTLADLNGDGFLDLIVANTRAGQVNKIYFNSGNPAAPFDGATVGVPFTAPNDPDYAHAVFVGDADNDGDLDIFVSTASDSSPPSGPNRLYLNDGAGSFPTYQLIGNVVDITNTGVAGDLDGDGDLDYIAGNEGRDATNTAIGVANRLYLNAGTDAGGPAVRQLRGVATSLRVDNEAGPIESVRLAALPESFGALNAAEFWVSSNGGVDWVHVVPGGRPVLFPPGKRGQDLRWRVRMHAWSPAAPHGAGGFAIDSVSIELNETGPQPTITIGDQSATQAEPFSVQAQFSDPDGDTVWYSLSGMPPGSGLSIDARTGLISGTPNAADVAASPIALAVVATDGAIRAEQPFTLTITPAPNDPPSFTSTAPTEATEGTAYLYEVAAQDPNGHALVIGAPTLPAWLTLTDNGDGTARLEGTPAPGDAGDHPVELHVTDELGGLATQAFTITVAAGPGGPPANEPPTITLNGEATVTVERGGTYEDAGATASDPEDGDLTAAIEVDNPVDTTVAGTYTVTYTVQDSGGATAQAERTVTVQAPAQNPNPPSNTNPPSNPPASGGGGGGGGGGSTAPVELLLLALLAAARIVRRRDLVVRARCM